MKIKVSPAEWVGRLIDKRFPLFEHLGSADSGDFFRTELPGPHTLKAAIRLVPAEIEGAQQQFDDWAQAEGLSHPHLLRIFESGRGRIDENEFLYVVMELPDESLDQVLPTRTLSGPEAGEMLTPILDALEYLHAQGLVHGHVNPSNILVVADQLKLSADALQQSGQLRKIPGGLRVYDAPELGQNTISPASDIWSLGVTLVEALTQLPPMRNPGGDPGVPRFMPEPFAEIARNCLRVDPSERASIEEIRAALRVPPGRTSAVPLTAPVASAPPAPDSSRPQAPSVMAAAPPPVAAPRETAARPPQAAAEPAKAPQPDEVPPDAVSTDEFHPSRRSAASAAFDDDSEAPRAKISTPFIIGMVALLVLLIAALFVRAHKSATAPATESQAPPVASAPPAAAHPKPKNGSHSKPKAAAPSPAPAAKPTPETPAAVSAPGSPAQQQAKGDVIERVMPDDHAHADRTIRGKVAVRVRLSVDRQGNVANAVLDQAGPSRYFAKIAVEAARKWRFRPPQVNGAPAPSTWLLRFEFRRGRTDVNPVEVTR